MARKKTVDAEAVDVTEDADGKAPGDPQQDLVPVYDTGRSEAGLVALSRMSEEDFEVELERAKTLVRRLDRIIQSLLVLDVDYGKIPGVDKPILLQDGAIQIARCFKLVPEYRRRLIQGDGTSSPHVIYETDCLLHLGAEDGPVVGAGSGVCNSWERKYRYRMSKQTCPACGSETIRSSEQEFYCWKKIGGCGRKFKLDEPRITQQARGQVDNPDVYDQMETILQMSDKRALVAAVRRTTAASRYFTQDPEAFEQPATGQPPKPEPTPPPAESGGGHSTPRPKPVAETSESEAVSAATMTEITVAGQLLEQYAAGADNLMLKDDDGKPLGNKIRSMLLSTRIWLSTPGRKQEHYNKMLARMREVADEIKAKHPQIADADLPF